MIEIVTGGRRRPWPFALLLVFVLMGALVQVGCTVSAGSSSGDASQGVQAQTASSAESGVSKQTQDSQSGDAQGSQSGDTQSAQSGDDQSAGLTTGKSSPLSPSAQIANFQVLWQNPEQPSGCEVTSLTMVLNYWGYPCTKNELADNYLPYGQVGDDMFKVMIGSVYSDASYGCYAPAIVTCAWKYAKAKGASYTAEDVSESSLEDYCRYVDQGYPLIVWATEEMQPTYPSVMWECDGKVTGYMAKEHCMVMIGYDRDEDIVVMADPLRGEVEYPLSTFYERNQSVFAQAVLIRPTE